MYFWGMEYMFVLAGGFASLFLLVLLSRRSKTAEHWFLAILFLLIIINCFYVFRLYKGNGNYYSPIFSEINYAIPLLYGVLLWLYTKALITKDYLPKWRDLLHLLPFLMFLGFLFYPIITQQETVAPDHQGYPLIKLIINPIYIFLTIHLLGKHRKKLFEQYSYVDYMHHYWLSWVAYGALLLWVVAILGNVFNWMNNYDTALIGDYFLLSFLAIFLFVLAYIGFNRTHIFQSSLKPDDIGIPIGKENLTFNTKENQEIIEKLRMLMTEEKPFLDPKLTLHSLSSRAEIPSNKLSAAINKITGENFYDFVNKYRVEAVKEELAKQDATRFSLLGIAMECGFNSKASFNRIFKKHTGQTPSEFLKKLTE